MVTASTGPDEPPVVLPEPVRHRVVALGSQALDEIDQRQVPPTLRKVARFTPARRARLAATAVATAVAADDAFRERVATVVRRELADVVSAIADGSVGALDPVDVAATAYLTRVDGWRETMSAALEILEADREASAATAAEEQATVERLRAELEQARTDLRTARSAHRAELDGLKSDNADLRRKLGDSRARVRAAEAERARVESEAAQSRERETARANEADAELRRLRQRLDAALAEAGDRRRQARDDRAATSTRARLLLESVIDSAQGLRRELALPPVDEMPADRVESADGAEAADTQRSHPVVSEPARLRSLVELPRVHVVVDGYNVTKSAWPDLPLDRQRSMLVSELGGLAARTSAEVTVVFDGAEVSAARPSARGVRVRFSAPGVTADDVIAELVSAEPEGRPLVVVSSDAEVSAHARRAGGRPATAQALIGILGRS